MFGTRDEKEPTQGTSTPTPTKAPQRSSRGNDQITAYLGPDTSLEGTLKFEHSVLIEGKFKGQIESAGSLVIGESAQVEAEIVSGTVSIKGKVEGSIVAKERVQIQGQGIVLGDITTPSLQMDEAVTFEGRCSMGGGARGGTSRKASEEKAKADKEKIMDAVESVS